MKWSIPEKVIEKGRRYVKEGRVLSVIENEDEKKWQAQVMGHEMYLVDLDGTAKEQDSCQCLFWQEKKYCKHTVAVELYLRELGLNRLMTQNKESKKRPPKISFSELLTQGLIESQWQKGVQTAEKIKYTFQIEALATNPYYPDRDFLAVSLKIGWENQRQYIVKNLPDFLLSYVKEEKIVINQQLPFFLGPQNTTKEVDDVMRLLYEIVESQQMLLQGGFSKKGKVEKKYVILPAFGIQKLLEKIAATSSAVVLIGGHFEKIHFEKKLPLQFIMEQKEKDFSLKIEDSLAKYFSYYHLGFSKGIFYQTTLAAENLYQTLRQLLNRQEKNEIYYDKKEVSTLFSKVFPLLEEIGAVHLSKEAKSALLVESLKLAFYFRKVKGEILLRVDYRYGEEIFSTDEKHQKHSGKVVVRQLKEEKVSALIKSFHFKDNATGFHKVLPTGEDLYTFFTKELTAFQSLGKVYVGKKLQNLFMLPKKHRAQIRVEKEDSWFAVHFDVSGIKEEISQVLKALASKKQFYETVDGRILDLKEPDFQEASYLLQQIRTKIQADGSLKLPHHQGFQVKQVVENFKRVSFDHDFTQMLKDLSHPQKFQAPLPKHLNAHLRRYQVEGFLWLKMLSDYQLGGILADDMGLGKTLQAITYLASEKEDGHLTAPALIVAPASLTYNWQSEIEKFAPNLLCEVIVGRKEERLDLLEKARTKDIIITSYASFRQDVKEYEKRPLSILCIDEAQMVKNDATKTSQALRKLKIAKRFALSGTPIENNLTELWSLFSIIMPGFFPPKGKFKELEVETIRKMIQPFVLRREKKHVLKELPEKIETNLYSSLLPEQKKLYLAYLKEMQESLSKMDKSAFSKNRISILAGLTRLRQICCDPRTFLPDFNGSSGKLEQLKDLVINAKKSGRRLLLFSQFTKMLDLIEEALSKEGIDTYYLKGSTPSKERLAMVNAFNEGKKDLFLISLKAGGTGLNLVGADLVVLFDLWWNPAVEQQAAGRAHRLGQKNVVEVFKMIAKGTIEEKMANLQEEKRALFAEVLNGKNDASHRLSEEDIREILAMGQMS